jgi:hypothetical protein
MENENNEVGMIRRMFQGRDVVPEDAPKPPAEKLYRCVNALPGCGQAFPVNHFYKEIKELCVSCSHNVAAKYGAGLESVPLIFSCYEITRQFGREAKALLANDEATYKAGFKKLVTDGGIERGRSHFIREMIHGSKTRPTDFMWFDGLRVRYRKWFFDEFGVPESLYSNLPKNDLLD